MEAVNYETAHEMAQSRRRKLGNNTYLEVNEDGSYGVQLHSTQVVVFHPDGRIVLDSGNWRTVTTKERMNRVLRKEGWNVGQVSGIWYISHNTYSYGDSCEDCSSPIGATHKTDCWAYGCEDKTVKQYNAKLTCTGLGTWAFADGITIHPDGSVSVEGKDLKQIKKPQ